MKLYYEVKDKAGLGYPYLIKGTEESLQPLVNYINTIEIYRQQDEPFPSEYHKIDLGIYLCEEEFIHLQQNQDLLGIELIPYPEEDNP